MRKVLPLADPEFLRDPVQSAKAVGLRYVSDQSAGIRRVRAGKNFRYVLPEGKPLRDEEELLRIKALAIPPAWENVWICPIENGHLQATGVDAKGRKQYRYHSRWREVRDETKYTRMIAFGKILPRIRQRVQEDLAKPGLPREKVLATVVRLLEVSLIRVGNEEYARANGSFGLTTMRDKHVDVNGSTIEFHFRGKSGKQHNVQVDDPRLARIVKRCQDLPGQELFQYIDSDGARQAIGSTDVNDYLKEVTGEDFTAKDFRTWAGTVLAARALHEIAKKDTRAATKKNIVRAVEAVAQLLGNTPSICRKCYVHPAVLEAYLDGALLKTLQRRAQSTASEEGGKLKPDETAILRLLEQQLKAQENAGRTLGHSPLSRSRRNGSSRPVEQARRLTAPHLLGSRSQSRRQQFLLCRRSAAVS